MQVGFERFNKVVMSNYFHRGILRVFEVVEKSGVFTERKVGKVPVGGQTSPFELNLSPIPKLIAN